MESDLVKRMGELPERTASAESIAESIDRIAAVKRAVRDWADQMGGALCAWIEKNGDLEIPGTEVRFYVGADKRARCIDPAKTFLAILDESGGDIEKAAETIAANGIKTGAAKQILGREWDRHYVTEKVERLKEGKATQKRLKRYDPRFSKIKERIND